MLGFEPLAGAPLAAGPSSLAPSPPGVLVGGDICLVAARLTLAVVEARCVVVGVAARQTLIEVTRGH